MSLGKFITFEGGEGAGKSTQAELLRQRLGALGIKSTLTREPGGSPFAEDIRHILLDARHKERSALADALLFYAARQDHLMTTIKPALEGGNWVISDRFSDSTRAYQGAAGGVTGDILKTLEEWVVGDQKPHLTYILDLPPELGLQRADERRADNAADRFENLDLDFHKRLRDGFLAIAKAEPGRCFVVDANREVDAIAGEIWRICQKQLCPEAVGE